MNNDVLKTVCHKIATKFGIDEQKAEELAKKLIEQIEAHGGNPCNEQQTDNAIEIVVRKWLNPRAES